MYAGSKYESHYTVWTAWISIRVGSLDRPDYAQGVWKGRDGLAGIEISSHLFNQSDAFATISNEADTPTSPSGKDTGIGRRNHAN